MEPKRLKSTRVSRPYPRVSSQGASRWLPAPRLHLGDSPPLGAVLPVEPWGVVVPAEEMHSTPCYIGIYAWNISLDATIVLHWEHSDGTGKQQDERVYEGGTHVAFDLPQAWMIDAIGKSVVVSYEMLEKNGTRTPSPPLEFTVAQFLEVPPVRYQEFEYGEPFEASRFPESIHAIIDRIPDVQDYHRMEFWLITDAYDSEGNSSIQNWLRLPVAGVADGPVMLTIPADAYTGFHSERYPFVRVVSHIYAAMLPSPNHEDWVRMWTIGSNEVLPS